MAQPRDQTLMLHDAGCGFCTRVADLVVRSGLRVTSRPLPSVDLASLGIDPERARREMPVVDTTGQVHWGHRAWAALLLTGPLPVRLAGRALGSRLVSPLAETLYRWVATHRHRLPGGTSACAMDPAPQRK